MLYYIDVDVEYVNVNAIAKVLRLLSVIYFYDYMWINNQLDLMFSIVYIN